MFDEEITLYPDEEVVSAQLEPVRQDNPYPPFFSKKCDTCKSRFREEIEFGSLSNTYVDVSKKLPKDARVSPKAISRHMTKHLSLEMQAKHAVAKEQARVAGIDLLTDSGPIGDYFVMAKSGIQTVVDKMNRGDYVPTIQEGISLAQLLLKVQQLAGDSAKEEGNIQAMLLIREAILKVCSPEQAAAIGQFVQTGGRIPLSPPKPHFTERENSFTEHEPELIDIEI